MARWKAGLTPILILLALVARLAAALAQPADAPAGEKLAYQFRDLTVRVTSYRGQEPAEEGYGFVVGQHDDFVMIITADHVVRDVNGAEYGKATVEFYSDRGHPLDAKLLEFRMSRDYGDLAVLEVEKKGFRMAPFQVAQLPLPQGTRAWRIGKQQGWTPGNIPGVYTGRERTIWLGFDNLDTPRGSSGGPILVEQGLIGMVTDDQSGQALVLPIDIIADWFREKGLPWGLGGTKGAIAASPPQTTPPIASGAITLWKVGSPHDGTVPAATVPPKLASLAQQSGHEIAVKALSARDFFSQFNDALGRHQEPDIFWIDNWGVMEGIKTALGQFEGLLGVPGMTERLTLVYKSLKEAEGPGGGWEFLVSGSPNAQAARALALRSPECDPSWTTGMGPGELNQLAPEAASAFLRNDDNELARLSDPARIGRGPKPNLMPQPFDQVRTPLQVTGIRQCSYWGNNRLRFGILVLRFETPKMIGNTPVLLILRNEGQGWRLLAATEDGYTVDQFSSGLGGLQFRNTPPASLGSPVPARLLSPGAGQSPPPASGQRFGDYVWQPSTSADVVAEIAEFSAPFGSRLFLKKRDGGSQVKDSVSAGNLFGSGGWRWRIWSIANSGIVTLSDR